MKIFKILFIFLIVFSNLSKANPVLIFFINEFQIDSSGWKLELKNLDFYGINLDSCYLSTSTDSAYFKPGIATTDSFLIITQDSLIHSLNINRLGDIIQFHYVGFYELDQLEFGNLPNRNVIAAPQMHQSICLREWYEGMQRYYYYLDNTPTFGCRNDTLNTKGYLTGIIADSMGNALPNVEVVYDYYGNYFTHFDISVFTDSTGRFILRDFARLNTLKIRKQNYQTQYIPVQIYPEDTDTINVTLYSVIDEINARQNKSPDIYQLSQNYPNPFNNSTSFKYNLPKSRFVEIAVYDISGKLVENLFSGQQNPGEYKVHWNAENVASGIYIYQFKTTDFITHKKCLLIK